MTTLPEIEATIRNFPDEELRGVCLQIFDRVAERMAAGAAGLWTMGVFAGWLRRDSADPALARGLQLLATKCDARLFDVHYFYYDPRGLHPEGMKIADSDVREAYDRGFLVDPDSGDEISDFEEALEPYFVPSAKLDEARRADC